MLDIIGKGILNLQTIETPGFFEKMRNYYSEPTLKGLYRDAITQYDSVEDIEKSLGYGFAYLKENFPRCRSLLSICMYLVSTRTYW